MNNRALGVYFELYSNIWALAVPNASINGGVCAQAIQSIFCKKSVLNRKYEVREIIYSLSYVITKMEIRSFPKLATTWSRWHYVFKPPIDQQ